MVHHTLECLVILINFECLFQRVSDIVIYSYTAFSSDYISEILKVSILPIAFLSLITKFFSSSLFLIIVCYLSWMIFFSMMISTVKEAWYEELYKSSRMKWLLISVELAQRNIRLITELESLGLSAYQVGTWI